MRWRRHCSGGPSTGCQADPHLAAHRSPAAGGRCVAQRSHVRRGLRYCRWTPTGRNIPVRTLSAMRTYPTNGCGCSSPAAIPLSTWKLNALTLHCLGGLSTPEVARAFVVPPATMAAPRSGEKKDPAGPHPLIACPARANSLIGYRVCYG